MKRKRREIKDMKANGDAGDVGEAFWSKVMKCRSTV
jgi:hypothetical protein